MSVAYGTTGARQLEASARVTAAPRRARAVLETRTSPRRTRARTSARISAGRVRLRWRVPPALSSVTVRVRVVGGGRRPRTLATGRWRTIRVTGSPRAAKVADVAASQVRSAPVPGQPGPVEIARRRTVRVGEILALGVGDATPDGLLARVTAVTRTAGSTIAETVPATLPEVLPSGALDVRLDPVSLRRMQAAPRTPFGRAVTCSSGAQLKTGGSAAVTAGVSLNVGWRFPARVTARFEGSVEARAELSASVSGEASCTLAKTPLLPQPIRLGAYTFTIGPVPIVLVPKVQLYVSAGASVQAAITTSAVASTKATAGVQYNGSTFGTFGGLTPKFTYTPPALTATGTAQAALTPTLDVLINGIGGPRVDLDVGLKLSADIAASPWWKLTAPISLGAQLRLDVWKLQLSSDRLKVFSAEPQIAAAQTPGPGVPAPDPAAFDERLLGVWTGLVRQTGAAQSEYDVTVRVLRPGAAGEVVGSIAYTPLGCSGPLTFDRREGLTTRLTERVNGGRCVPVVQIQLTPNPDGTTAYRFDNGGSIGTAVLRRTAGATAMDPRLVKRWTGTAEQRQRASGTLESTYPVELTVQRVGTNADRDVATVRYPTLGCGGVWTYVGTDDLGSLFTEQVSGGSCVPEGEGRLALSAGGQQATYSWEGAGSIARATLAPG